MSAILWLRNANKRPWTARTTHFDPPGGSVTRTPGTKTANKRAFNNNLSHCIFIFYERLLLWNECFSEIELGDEFSFYSGWDV